MLPPKISKYKELELNKNGVKIDAKNIIYAKNLNFGILSAKELENGNKYVFSRLWSTCASINKPQQEMQQAITYIIEPI